MAYSPAGNLFDEHGKLAITPTRAFPSPVLPKCAYCGTSYSGKECPSCGAKEKS